MSIESDIAEIKAAGLRINNLFERVDGQWQCNLRCDGPDAAKTYYTFAVGPTMQEALLAAMQQPPTQVFMTANGKVKASLKDTLLRLPGDKKSTFGDLLE